ncbi:MAG: F0F1 ATP synthase subunit delta [Hormoscilla sp. GM7CHS1pb]|nr:F0F1 ATP synthase subunit delta [Hormoscilla sp. GM7CHS1pb]
MKGGMVIGEIVEPYAEGLMSLAQEQNLTERLGEDVRDILKMLSSSPEFSQLIANPLIKPEAKKAVLRQVGGDRMHPYTLNFLMLLVDRRRLQFLEGICKQYQAILRKLNQTVLAEVTSTVELTEAQKQAAIERVKGMTGAAAVELESKIDPEIIGGVIIKVGSQVIDASLRGQLRRIGISLNAAS